MSAGKNLRRLAGEESGFTLVELVVVMMISIVTAIALFSFQDLVLRQSGRVFAHVDATQDARIAMEKIENRLHSSCVGEGVTPVLAGSDADTLLYISKIGSAASVVPEKHKLELAGTTLTDTTYAWTSGSTPAFWQFSSTPTGSPQKILTNVKAAPGKNAFSYYGYGPAKDSGGNGYIDAAGNPYYMLLDGLSTLPSNVRTSTGNSVGANTMPANSPDPMTVPLFAVAPAGDPFDYAGNVAEVAINLEVDADGGLGANPENDTAPVVISDSVVFRITPVPSDNNQGVPPPCE